MPKIQDVIQVLEKKASSKLAEGWDNVGLTVGDQNGTVKNSVVSNSFDESALALAKKTKSELIICHHPVIFTKDQGLAQVVPSGKSRLIYEAVKNNISVYVSHSNFDRAALEVNELIAKGLNAEIKGRLFTRHENQFLKLVAFVPSKSLEKVQNAIFHAGAGQIGNYDSCGFSIEGTGTFRGNVHSNPTVGKKGKLEKVDEYRFETVVPRALKDTVLQALLESHPYEEVAYDFYPVELPNPRQGHISGLGYGFYADLKRELTFKQLFELTLKTFGTQHALVSGMAPGSESQKVKRIGYLAGDGGSFYSDALKKKCDVFITGELGFHNTREALRQGMKTIELGHAQSEIFFLEVISRWLSKERIGIHKNSVVHQSFA